MHLRGARIVYRAVRGKLTCLLLVVGLSVACIQANPSQITRADLAVRLIEMESCWEQHRASYEARLRATRPLTDALSAFFLGQFGVLARNLTLTCAVLRSADPPPPEVLYAGSIGVRLPRVIDLDKGGPAPEIRVFHFYRAEKPDRPLQLRWRVIPLGARTWISEGMLDQLEEGATAVLLRQAAEGDYEVQFEIRLGEETLRQWKHPLSAIVGLTRRLDALDQAMRSQGTLDPIERATVAQAVEALRTAQNGGNLETSYPVLRLLESAERMASRWREGKPGWEPVPGDYWMAAPYRGRRVVFRLFVPRRSVSDRPIPLVIALHGAGGNEHLFFEGYGLGIILKEAEKRGWAVVAPRAEMGLIHIGGALEAAGKLLPVDAERIYLVGHSMGGAHSFAAISEFPDRFRAAAILAGAGQPTRPPTDLSLFLGVGEQEIAMLKANVESAYRRLREMGVTEVEYKKYDACDHLMIVREALPDAFPFFERARARRPRS